MIYLKSTNQFQENLNQKNLELYKLYFESQKNQNLIAVDSFGTEIDNLAKRKYLYTINFANTHSDKMISPYIIINEANNVNPNFLDTISKKMPDNIKNSKYGRSFFKLLERNKLQLMNKE
jgi:hypothetical protein